MKKICFLLNKIERIEPHNYYLLCNAAIDLNHKVCLCDIDTLKGVHDKIIADTVSVEKPLDINEQLTTKPASTDLAGFDLVWLMSFGMRKSYLDKIQMLNLLQKQTRLINSVKALHLLGNKYSLPTNPLFQTPTTYASKNADYLWQLFRNSKKRWIVKPPAESWGRNVFLLDPDDSNARVIIEMMTGNDSSQYCILQEYIDEIGNGEKRVLLCGNQIITYYQRMSEYKQHRHNLHAGATAVPCRLSEQETELCQKIGEYYEKTGAVFMGIDLVYPFVIEINVVNPGGLKTALDISGKNHSHELIKSIVKKIRIST
jgi:glutathione synthase